MMCRTFDQIAYDVDHQEAIAFILGVHVVEILDEKARLVRWSILRV